MPLTLNHALFDDELINPLNHNIDETYFISTKSSELLVESESFPPHCNHCDFSLSIRLFMSGWKRIEQRTRYNYWDLLGDVGGFNDGLFLIFSIFMSIFS